jgi:hypothetical protein
MPRVSCDEQRVVETCGGPDDCVGEFEFVFLAELNRFASDRFIKLNNWKQPKKILPDPSQCVGRCANQHFHPGDPADRDALIKRKLFGGVCDPVKVVNQHVRIKAANHDYLFPLIPQPANQFDRVLFAESLAAAESGMFSKVDLFV